MKKVFFLFMTMIMVVGCQEEEIVNSEVSVNNKEFIEKEEVGMLNFKSFEELHSFVEKNEGADLLSLAKTYSKEGVYNPLLLIYALGEDKPEDAPEVNTESGVLLLLLNENGEIEVEDAIYRIDGEFVYSYSSEGEGSSDQINTFLEEYSEGGIELEKGDTIEYDNITVFHHENNVEFEGKSISARAFNTNVTAIDSVTSLRGTGVDEYWFFISFVWFSTNVEHNSALPGFLNMLFNSVSSDNRLNYDVGIQTDYITAPWLPSATNYFGDDVNLTTKLLWRLPKLSVGFPAPERYTITLGGSLHETYWGVSPTGSHHDVFIAY